MRTLTFSLPGETPLTKKGFDGINQELTALTDLPGSVSLKLDPGSIAVYDMLSQAAGKTGAQVGRGFTWTDRHTAFVPEVIEFGVLDPPGLEAEDRDSKVLSYISFLKNEEGRATFSGKVVLLDPHSIEASAECFVDPTDRLMSSELWGFADRIGFGSLWSAYQEDLAGARVCINYKIGRKAAGVIVRSLRMVRADS